MLQRKKTGLCPGIQVANLCVRERLYLRSTSAVDYPLAGGRCRYFFLEPENDSKTSVIVRLDKA